MEFKLTPHVKSILCGRGMCDDGRLLCAATNCIFHPKESPDPTFERDIRVKGYGVCPRCGAKTDWDEREDDPINRKSILRCGICKRIIPMKNIIWTQVVVSKHRRSNHLYYHKECWGAMFFDIPDDAM